MAHLSSQATPWLTRREAAVYARCAVRHIDGLAAKGERKRYAGTRYRKDDIDRCILKGRFANGNKGPKPGFKAKEQIDRHAEAKELAAEKVEVPS
jgi:hypothetical protein